MEETKDHKAAAEEEKEKECPDPLAPSGEGKPESLLADLHKCGAHYESLIKRTRQRLEDQVAQFEAERMAFEAMRAKLREGAPRLESRVKLNVGGKIFVTSLDTLCTREPNSFLAAMFSGEWKLDTDAKGAFFIDRYLVPLNTH